MQTDKQKQGTRLYVDTVVNHVVCCFWSTETWDGGQEGGNELSLAGFLVDGLLRNVYILIRTDVLIE